MPKGPRSWPLLYPGSPWPDPELSWDSCGGKQLWYVPFYFHSKHSSWDHPNKLSILFSAKALALSRNVFRTKQIAKANILFLSARTAEHCKNISGQDFQWKCPPWWSHRHCALCSRKKLSGYRAVAHPHVPWGWFLFQESPPAAWGRGAPSPPCSQLSGTAIIFIIDTHSHEGFT